MEKFRVFGASVKAETARETKNRELARRVAAEGMVLLENDGALPLKAKKVSLFGSGARMTVKGGSGSGDVHERYSVSIEQGLQNTGFEIIHPLWLNRFDDKYAADKAEWKKSVEQKIKGYGPARTMKMFDIIHENPMPYPAPVLILEDELSDKTDTAIYVVSRQAGEGSDRRNIKGDYLLSDIEEKNLQILSEHYPKLILVINSGCLVDLSVLNRMNVSAVIYYSQGGCEGGNALANILCGAVSPSGKLTDTWAYRYADYPSADTFSYLSGDLSHNDYYEGIYVGYRYFDTFRIQPRYCFGYGLSYSKFELSSSVCSVNGTVITLQTTVKNSGTVKGKEVVQLYLSKPCAALHNERRTLVAFAKTKALSQGETETVTLTFDLAKEGKFDTEKGAFVLEKGEYGLFIGNSLDNSAAVSVVTLGDTIITEEVKRAFDAPAFEELTPEISHIAYDESLPRIPMDTAAFATQKHSYNDIKYTPSDKVRNILQSMNDKELISLCVGGGYNIKPFINVPGAAGMTCTKLLKKGIPNIVLSDGPAGINIMQATSIQKNGTPRYPEGLPEDWNWGYLKHLAPLVKAKPNQGRLLYHYMTAFPCETLQAQTWNTALIEEVGKAIGEEMLEVGVTVWLAPGMNLHRNPLCGRNFEYYSEDAFLSGKLAAAITRGVQSFDGIGVCIKHFCCNNQEDNRDGMSANVSERAIRELYLKGFRIAVSEAKPLTLMTSYNQLNGTYTPNHKALVNDILRCEWRYDGVVMSDWNTTDKCSHATAINIGNDLLMPGNQRVMKSVLADYQNGKLNRQSLMNSATRVLTLILNAPTSEGF
ncbi:MAG: glycoside hydrolase family 3 protein [Eubacterium sp.]|nr:glycoside hydrolase family 3 protein [Eubacterium sp.]